MKNSANLLRQGLALAALLGAVSGGWAFDFILNDDTGLPLKWSAGPVKIKILLGTTPTLQDGTNYNTSVAAAADTWNAKLGSVQFTNTQGTGSATNNNDNNELAFASDVFGKAFETNVLAVTTTWHAGNERVEGDIIFNSAKNWDSYRGALQTSTDIRRVAIHELGHLLGLDHPDEATPTQNVSAIMNSHVGVLDTLADDDIQGAQSLYGPPGEPANNAFANAATISTTGGLVTLKGYNTNATKEAGEPSHAGNIGGRSVWWKWKPTNSGTATIDTKGSYFDTTLAVYTGTALNSLTSIASDDDVVDGKVQASTVDITVTGGTTYYIAVDGFSNNDAAGADNGGITLNVLYTATAGSPPSILTQPAPVTVDVGGNATFSVSASGSDPLSYQWLFNGVAIAGATNTSYSINNVQTANGGTYSVTVTNNAGSVTSAGVALNVRAPAPTPTPTPSGGGGGGGGGGAPSLWFVGVLAALGLRRLWSRRG